MSTKTRSESKTESSIPSIPGLPTISNIPGWVRSDSVSKVTGSTEVVKDAEKAIQDVDTKEMLKWTMMLIGAFTILRSLSQAFFSISIGLFPGLYAYLYYTCPKEESFDVRKEWKRVLRGYHLSDDHPDKPKGYLESVMARAVASVTVESTVLTGYKLESRSYGGAFIVTKLQLPSKEMEVYWIGVARQWHHVYTRNLGDMSKKSK
jgi:hypothetical protein